MAKKAPRAKKSAKPVRARAQSTPSRSSGRSSGGYEILCSECYAAFTLRPQGNQTKITCPECLHVGELGQKDTLTKIAIAKSTERSGLLKAVIPAIIFLVVGIAYVTLLSGTKELAPPVNYGLLGAMVVFFIISLAMVFKYEGNRYEVYF